MYKSRILVMENSREMKNLLSYILKAQQYRFKIIGSAKDMLIEEQRYSPDALLMDLDLFKSESDGMDTVKHLRLQNDTPMITLSERTDDDYKANIFDAGADDYLVKPFSAVELLARLRAALRRNRRVRSVNTRSAPACEIYKNGELTVDYSSGCVYRGTNELKLTPVEYKILCLLVENEGKIVSYGDIAAEIGGVSDKDNFSLLYAMISHIRKQLETNPSKPEYIKTYVGKGYKMEEVHDISAAVG